VGNTSAAQGGIWNNAAGGNWGIPTNWSANSLPDGVDTQATFGSVIAASRTVSVDNNVTVGTLLFDNANAYTLSGSSSITLATTGGAASVTVNNGSHTIASPLVLSAANTTFAVTPAASVLTVSADLSAGASAITKTGAGTVQFKNVRAASLNVSGGTVAILADGTAAGVSKVTTLTLGAGAKLDLRDNKLITAGAVGTLSGNTYSDVTGLIQSGRNAGVSGKWSGSGIVTSQTLATTGNLTSIGVATAAQAKGISF